MIHCPKCGLSTEQLDGEGNVRLSCPSCGVTWLKFLEAMANDKLWPAMVSRDKHEIICPKCGYERYPSDKATPRTICPSCRKSYANSLIGPPPVEPPDEQLSRSTGSMTLPDEGSKSEVFALAMAGKKASVGQQEWSQAQLDDAEESHRMWLNKKSEKEAKTRYPNTKATPVFWGVLAVTAIPAVYLANSFVLGLIGIFAALVLAIVAWAYAYAQLRRAHKLNPNSVVRYNGLDSELRRVIVAMSAIWVGIFLLNGPPRSAETAKPTSTISATNEAEETRRKLQRDQLRAERDALQPTVGQLCRQGNDDACRQYREWEVMRKY